MSRQPKWKSFSKEQLDQFIKESKSYAALAEKCGYKKSHGSYLDAMKEMVAYYHFDVSHFTGQGWNKGNFDYIRFRKGKAICPAHMRDALIALRGHKCECCGLSEWMGKPITLEVHHIDGDSLNNELSNLQLLCPNCHSYTDNWRGKNIQKSKVEPKSEEEFKEALETTPNIRQALLKLGLAPKGGNYARANEVIAKYHIVQNK